MDLNRIVGGGTEPALFAERDPKKSLCFLMGAFASMIKNHRESGYYGADLLSLMVLAVKCGGPEFGEFIAHELGGGPELDTAVMLAKRRV